MAALKRDFDWSVLRPGTDSPEAPKPPGPACPGQDGDAGRAPVLDSRSGATGASSLLLRVNDLKQYSYCQRIVFYQYTMPVERRATFKMEHGKAIEPKVEELEHRRKLREYGLTEGTRRFQVALTSARLGLSGRLDLLISTPQGAFPVDFKDTVGPIRQNHRVQLCAYALLVEDVLSQTVPAGFIYRVPRNDVAVVELTSDLRDETLALLDHIRRLIAGEQMPPPTAVRARCEDCEYRNYCGDVF